MWAWPVLEVLVLRLLCEIQQIISVVNYFNVINIEFSNCFTLLIDAMKSLEF